MTNSNIDSPYKDYTFPTLDLLHHYEESPTGSDDFVSIEDVIKSEEFQNCDMELPLALGKTKKGKVYLMDLAQAPHLLIAGAANEGLQSGLKTIITSLLYKKRPEELKLVLIDSAGIYFDDYNKIGKHFLATNAENTDIPVVCKADKALKTLKSVATLMDVRYDLLKKSGARNIKEYNGMCVDGKLNSVDGHHYMPYVVLIVNEFVEHIMIFGKEMEMLLASIAQMSRAVGIHTIIATQRPGNSCISGIIKANYTSRIAFKMSSSLESWLIIDSPKAANFKTDGSMLLLHDTRLTQLQCAYVDMAEVERINDFIASQPAPDMTMILPEPGNRYDSRPKDCLDPLYDEIVDFVLEQQPCTCAMIQRKFSIGYNRACCVILQIRFMAGQSDTKAVLAIKNLETKKSI